MKRTLSFLLILSMCLSFAACTSSEVPPRTSAVEETTEAPVTDIDLTQYKFIRPEKSSAAYDAMYGNFFARLREKTGYSEYRLGDDFVREGTPYVEEEYEVLIGATNREESAQALEGKGKTEYAVVVIGTKIVINGGTRLALGAAMDAFIDSLTGSSTLVAQEKLSITGDFTEDSYYPVLEGVRLTAMGDSYFQGSGLGKDGVWLKLLADEYGMTLNNYGIGGSTVSNFVGADGKDRNPMCDRISTMKSGADIVIIEGGRNDYNVKAPLGDIDSRDKGTFAGALNCIIDEFEKKYPEAMLMGVTGWYVNDSMQAYVRMMLAVCEARGIVCFDASDQKLTGVYMNDPNFRAEYCLSASDVSHLNAAGMALVEPVFEKFIAEEYEKFLANKKGN
ncbi:MAG: SGNH/GDSL hydrolase family protein [Eubacteriales bacterium]